MLASALSDALSHTLSPLAVSFSTGVALLIACVLFGSHRVLRWPLLLVAYSHIVAELSFIALMLSAMGLWDELVLKLRPNRARSRLLTRLAEAASWEEYREAGRELDRASAETVGWQAQPEHAQYNAAAVQSALQRLRAARAADDVDGLVEALGACVRKSFSGIDHEALYSACWCGTKRLVEAYVDEVVAALGYLRAHALGRGDAARDARVASLLQRAQRVFGRTCLALSGGGGLANFSWGVARALYDQRLLPSLICGTSAGAVVAATLCTHTDAELDALLTSEALVRAHRAPPPARRVREAAAPSRVTARRP